VASTLIQVIQPAKTKSISYFDSNKYPLKQDKNTLSIRESRNGFRDKFITSNFQLSQPEGSEEVSQLFDNMVSQNKDINPLTKSLVSSLSTRSLSKNGRKFKVREASIEADGSTSNRSGRIIGKG
jgi:hypothetical protein